MVYHFYDRYVPTLSILGIHKSAEENIICNNREPIDKELAYDLKVHNTVVWIKKLDLQEYKQTDKQRYYMLVKAMLYSYDAEIFFTQFLFIIIGFYVIVRGLTFLLSPNGNFNSGR